MLQIVYDLCFFRYSKTKNIVIFGIEYRQLLSITIREYQHQPQFWSTVIVEMILLKLNMYKLLTQWYQYILDIIGENKYQYCYGIIVLFSLTISLKHIFMIIKCNTRKNISIFKKVDESNITILFLLGTVIFNFLE